MFRSFLFALVVFLSTFATTTYGQFYTLGAGQGLIEDISDTGLATGSFGNPDNQYFIWEAGVGGKVNIGGVPAGNGVGGQASISNDGTKIGGTTFNASSGFHEMSMYDVGTNTWTPLGGLNGSSGTSISSGWGMSGDGQSVVGLGWVNAGEAHAIHWRDGNVTDLGSTFGNESTRANAVNFNGSVIGGWQDAAGRQGAVWVDGVQEIIVDNSPQNFAGEVFGLNGNGQFATGLGAGSFNGIGRAYRYDTTTDTFLALDNLEFGAARFMAGTSITDDGRIIVGGTWGTGPATLGNGFVWEEGIGTMTVREYLLTKGFEDADFGNFNFNFVSAISSDGQWLAGWGGTGAFANQSWVVRIQPVPEPGFSILGVMACCLLGSRRRKRT